MATIGAAPAADPILPLPPRDAAQIELEESSLTFPLFTANTAWTLGSLLRSKLQAFARPAIVDISLAQGGHCLFRCASHPGTTPDNDSWVARKRNVVLRWGCSTWLLQHRVPAGVDFATKYALGAAADQYAAHGGGWPIRVKGKLIFKALRNCCIVAVIGYKPRFRASIIF